MNFLNFSCQLLIFQNFYIQKFLKEFPNPSKYPQQRTYQINKKKFWSVTSNNTITLLTTILDNNNYN